MPSGSSFQGLVEFAPGFASRPQISHVLFDFDGTLSLIREGWMEVMIPMFAEMLPRCPRESNEARRQLCREDIERLNGRQTIYQMLQLVERIKERGGTPQDALWYKREYLRRLHQRIAPRIEVLRQGTLRPDEFLVYGARSFLDILHARGLRLFLASGTDQGHVIEEAELLNLTPYFGREIYGALDDYKQFSKKKLIERILKDAGIPGNQLLSFGDGYVEIEDTKQAGGLAIGVATDEAHNESGRFDEWKLRRLRGVGAEVLIPDYRDGAALVECLLGTGA